MKKIICLSLAMLLLFTTCKKDDGRAKKRPPDGGGSLTELDWPPSGLTQQVEPDLKSTGTKNYYIIFDGSGSMEGEKLEIAKKAFIQFINKIPDKSNIGLVSFDKNGFYERAPLGSTRQIIIQEVNKITAGGNTPLGGCIRISYEKLGLQAKKQMGYGEYNLIILTDGQATDSGMDDVVEMILDETPIVIHTIGLMIGPGHALNQPGKIYYRAADNMGDISSGLESVLAETEDFTVMGF